ncbi:NAD(P)-dependent oxidoreductase [Edaphobacter albus]|uniref:NAD(P)-dependent oxidoreductase n=1 Tax=Edaphobacter sp. 4G125 TaxID=2763071 RepID=UPI001647858D|nr:SDR family oxidoreductase [Edaphobacter sp. 4G125]QNI36687.1 SDR family oxidoreductase [Edaphobacter sp. 4G125]
MRLIILGATGGIGRLLLPLALDQGHQVTAFVRSPQKITQTNPNLRVIGGDLFDSQQMAEAVRGSDVVLSAFGPVVLRPTHQRRDFGRGLVEALRAARVQRFIHVSSAFVFNDGGLVVKLIANTLFRNVTVDHRDSEKEMAQSDLAWTILRPPRLTNDPATNRFRVASGHLPKNGFTISRADVATFMIEEAIAPRYVRQVVGLSN